MKIVHSPPLLRSLRRALYCAWYHALYRFMRRVLFRQPGQYTTIPGR
ncbi:hypothetical protein GXB81_16265 [Paraburkholderia sp. Ac-20336]|nr:hypothetical protein [Paraburkholderia sp. Ac-20336]MBN3804586.1 hypothetical protein [Paraburkholderia sp. Ac-20336]